MPEEQTITPFLQVLNFQEYFNNILQDLTGKKVKIQYKKDEKGAIVDLDYLFEPIPTIKPILNENGANFVIGALRTFMSPQLLIANLNRDTIVRICVDVSMKTFIPLVMGKEKYSNIEDITLYNSLMLSYSKKFFWSLYLYLTALVGGGARNWLAEPYRINVYQQQPQEEKKPPTPFLHLPFGKGEEK